MKVGVVAALPGELRPLVKGWRANRLPDGTQVWNYAGPPAQWVAACSGMGAQAVARALAAVEASGPPDVLLSIGFAGALDAQMRPGAACVIREIIDVSVETSTVTPIDLPSGEGTSLGLGSALGSGSAVLITVSCIAGFELKRALHRRFPDASLVDMEGAAVARHARARGIPMGCVKGISDGPDARLPPFENFVDMQGRLRLGPFLWWVAFQPRQWPGLVALGRASSRAAKAMRAATLDWVQQWSAERPAPLPELMKR